MKQVETDSLGIGLPGTIPAGTTVRTVISFSKRSPETLVLPSTAVLMETEGEYCYVPEKGVDYHLPAELLLWGPEVMKSYGGEFHRQASEELSNAVTAQNGDAMNLAMYKLKFVYTPQEDPVLLKNIVDWYATERKAGRSVSDSDVARHFTLNLSDVAKIRELFADMLKEYTPCLS
jgi:hypothetical protein